MTEIVQIVGLGLFIFAVRTGLAVIRHQRRQFERLAIAKELQAQAARFLGIAVVLNEGGARRQLVACAQMLRARAADLSAKENLSKDNLTTSAKVFGA